MAMSLDTAIKFTAKLEGQGLDQLKRGLQGLSQQSQVSKRSLDQLYTATKVLGSASNNTIAGLQKTASALRVLRDQADFGSRKFRLLSNDIEAVEARLRRFQGTAAKTGGIGTGQALLAGVAGGVSAQLTQYAVQGAQAVVRVGLDAESSQVRLKALTNEFGEYNQAQQAAARIAQTLRLSTIEAQSGFADLYAALRPTGVTIQEVEKAFIGFTAAARNSGATAQESSAALVQLKQALASGVLQGEELRSIREQAPLVAQAIAKEMGVSIGALKDLASQGEVTSDVVLRALAKLSESQLGKLNAQFDTGTQALKDLSNAASELGTEVAKTFGPTAVALIRDFTRFLRDASIVWNSLFGGGDAAARQEEAVRARQQALQDAQRRFPNPFGLNIGERESYLRQRETQIRSRLATERVTRQLNVDQPTTEQIAAQNAAGKEREAARAAARKKALEDELKIRKGAEDKLANAAQRNAEQLADFQRETAKRAAALERDLGDERLKIERQIADIRTNLQGVLEDRQLEAERQRLAAAGLSTEGIDTAREVKEIFRRYDEQKIENDRNAVDAQTDLQRRLEEYKIRVAEGIGKIQEGYARTVSNILQDAGEKLAEKMRQGAQDAATTLGGAGGASVAPPAPMLPGALAAGLPAGVQQAGGKLDAALNESKRQQQLLNEQRTLAALQQQYGAITDALSSQQELAGNKLRDELRYFELIKQGVNPEIAKQRVELEATAAIEQTKLLEMEQELQAKIATLPVESALRQELEKQVQTIEERLNLQGLLVDKTLELADAEHKAREEREKTEQRAAEIKELYASIKGTIAQGIIGGIEATIEAAMTGAEDLEDQLKQIAAGVLKQIGSALLRFGLNSLFPGFGFANGGVMTSSGPAPLKRYSQGGIANRPQLALYGEGSKPEAYVPLPDGRRIPVALQGQDKMREVMGAGPAQGATSPVLNMSFQTTNIGGVEYVSREQLEAAMAQTRRAASRDGAKRGMTMTLDKLQQSPSTRTRVGLR